MLTVTLNDGRVVLAKHTSYGPRAKTFANLAQANRARDLLGVPAHVSIGHPKYVVIGNQPEPKPDRATVYTLEAGRLICRDGKPFVTIHRVECGDYIAPSEVDDFTRRIAQIVAAPGAGRTYHDLANVAQVLLSTLEAAPIPSPAMRDHYSDTCICGVCATIRWYDGARVIALARAQEV